MKSNNNYSCLEVMLKMIWTIRKKYFFAGIVKLVGLVYGMLAGVCGHVDLKTDIRSHPNTFVQK